MIVGPLKAANVADFVFRLKGFETQELRVTGFDGVEGMSRMSEFRVRLCSTDAGIDTDALLGQPASLEIAGEHGTRYFHGIVRRFEMVEDGARLTHYEAVLVPPHWLLTQRVQSRIFQKPRYDLMQVVDIVSYVCEAAGLPSGSLTYGIENEYEEREFIVQYRESDWDFINRLLEEEGVFYYFEHTAEGCSMVVADHKNHVPYVMDDEREEDADQVPYRDPNGLVPEQEFVYRARFASQIRIGSIGLDDFNFRDPGGELRVEAADKRFSGLKMEDYPGKHVEKQVGQRRADRRLQQQQAGQSVARMSATVRQLQPGTTFRLIEHPVEKRNIEYLITNVCHRALQTQSGEEEAGASAGCRYEAEIDVIPSETPFRPARTTPRPTVLGSQTAIVVGPQPEEVYTDEYGRVKVRFHWDQEADFDENASCWIRVSQGWAGGQYGMLFLPRVGQEVIVDFLEGDADQPIITGRVYNKDHMPPYKLPDNRTISAIRTCSSPGAKGANEIRFDDAKGSEQLALFAQNSMHLRSRGSRFENVGGNQHRTVAKNSYELVKEAKHSTVKLDRLEDTQGSLHVRVEKDVKESVRGRKTTYVDKKYAILSSEGVVVESDTAVTLKCKGNFIQIDASGVTIVGKKVMINSGGTAATWEWDSPDLLELPAAADTTDSGRNTRYKAKPVEDEKVELETGAQPPDEAQDETETSWIEIELVDHLGHPCAGEAYVVQEPDGNEHKGALDAKGMARVGVKEPGECQITFPKLDAAAWERDTGAGGGAGGIARASSAPDAAAPAVPSNGVPNAAPSASGPIASQNGDAARPS